MTNSFSESEERQTLRREVAKLASKYGRDYFTEKARSGGKTTELWLETVSYTHLTLPTNREV